MGSSPKKLFGPAIGGSLIITGGDPIPGLITKKAGDMAPSNDLVKFATPGATMQRRIDSGEARTPRMVGDPGAFFTKTKEQQDTIAAADAYAADAPNRAALAATSSANVSLRAKNLRRRASSLSTGADTGGALLQTPTAYGKSSLGG